MSNQQVIIKSSKSHRYLQRYYWTVEARFYRFFICPFVGHKMFWLGHGGTYDENSGIFVAKTKLYQCHRCYTNKEVDIVNPKGDPK